MKNLIKSEVIKIILFLLILVVFGLVINSNSYLKKDMEYINITKDSQLYLNGKLVCIGDVSKYDVSKVKYDDIVVITKQIKKNNINNTIITFNNLLNVAYEVKVEGSTLYKKGMSAPENSVVCNNWVCVPTGKSVSDKKIEITLRCINDKVFAKIPEILFMNCKEEERSFAVSNIEYIIFGVVFIIIAILLIVFMLINMNFGIYNKKVIYVALTSFATGNWVLACFQIYKLFTDSNYIDFYAEYLSLGLGMLFINLYVNELCSSYIEKKILMYIRICLTISTILMVLLQVNNIIYMNDSVICMQLCGVFSVIMLFRCYFIEVKKNMQTSLMLMIESVTFAIVIIYYIISHVASKGIDVLNLIILMFALFVLQATTRIIQEIQASYIMTAEEKSITKLAFLDTLTGISNRRGFEKFIKKLSEDNKEKKYTLCSFDLNRLKYANDTYGHAVGDMLIKTFATSLKEAITQDEFCGRMGGDEFIAMVEVKRTDMFLENLKNIINKVNTEETCACNVSYSVGKAVYTNDDSVDIDTVLKIADSEMYDMKQSSNHGQKA